MVFTTCLYFMIAVAIVLYLYIDGKQLGTDILCAFAFCLIVGYICLMASLSVVFLILMIVVGPVIRVVFRKDSSKINNKVMPWLIGRLDIHWLDKLKTKADEELKRQEKIKRGYHVRRN